MLIAAGFGLIWWRSGSLRPGAPLPLAGLGLVALIAVAPIVSVMALGMLVRREQRKEA